MRKRQRGEARPSGGVPIGVVVVLVLALVGVGAFAITRDGGAAGPSSSGGAATAPAGNPAPAKGSIEEDPRNCPECRGSRMEKCKPCEGTGKGMEVALDRDFKATDQFKPCGSCDGKGWHTCWTCGGR